MSGKLKVLCPFCNAVQTAKTVHELEFIDEGCDTCGYGAEATGAMEVYCEACNKLIYKKEITMT